MPSIYFFLVSFIFLTLKYEEGIKMKSIFKKVGTYQLFILILIFIFSFSFTGYTIAYYQSPSWNSNFNFGWGRPDNYLNYNSYQAFSNPYMYGPAMGIYYPYNTMFDVYNGAYNINAAYNQNFMGFFNSGNYTGYGQQDINTIGYPLPYGIIDQRAWNTQMNTTSGIWGFPPMTASYMNVGNPYNIYYDPAAFTFDLGLEASQRGIWNFWTGIFDNQNDDEDDDD